MASIQKRTRDGKVTWRAHYRTPDGIQRNRSFSLRREAERFITEVEGAKLAGTYIEKDRSAVRVAEWVERWLESQAQLKPSTRERYAGILRTHVTPKWGNYRLRDVSHADIQGWVSEVAQSRSASTATKAHRVLSLALGLAVRDGRLPRNPADSVQLPRIVARDRRYLTHAEVERLAAAADEYGPLILFLAYTGARFGEAAALRVSRLDLLRRRVEIAESATSVNGRIVWGTPKGHQRRSIAYPRFLVDDLAALAAGKQPGDLVFVSPRGDVLRSSNFRRDVFEPAAYAAGLSGLTPHGLRHTAASLAIASGADVKVVQQMMGHKSATMTLDLYGHLFTDRLDEVADRMDKARADAAVARPLPEGTVVDLQSVRNAAEGQ
ncbi:site-specific integrase [Jatrophihabitans telluris]|uniref:Site-specific integrase n=1 Tax=Jatrophihabitans telluris TaxID=2038343 RepID=A0ABY4R004_9ACTN|nr:site-specific integrase [Jatrophihabitans telluris]UQX89208.1 site-specific integrase [Jatrophihabitans telluris]